MGDLARDVVRKRKIQLALAAPSSVDGDGTAAQSVEDEERASKRARKDTTTCWDDSAIVDGVKLGSQSRGGISVPVDEVQDLIPTRTQLPFMRVLPFRFPDRLGWHVTNLALVSGTYPRPDGDAVVVFRRMTPAPRPPYRDEGAVVRAAPRFHGRPVYSFVELEAGEELWYGQVLLLFTCVFDGERRALALIEYLDEVQHGPLRFPNKKTFRRLERVPECVDLCHVLRPVTMVTVPRGAGMTSDLFVLVDH